MERPRIAGPQPATQDPSTESPYRSCRCGKAKVVHAVVVRDGELQDAAMCTYRPSYRSKGLEEQPGAAITCGPCLERIGRAS